MPVEPASLSQAQSVRRLSRRAPCPGRRRRIRQRDKFLGEVDLDLPTACRGGPSPSDTVISEHRNPCEKTMTDDAAWPLAQHVCRTGYADLPASAVESARRDILDTFGCMLGGSGSPGIAELFAVIDRWGGREESRVVLRGTRLPAPQAALLNASMGHALDFDDTLDTGGSIHPGVSVLGSVLAVCDSLRSAVSGRDVLLAAALGLDVSCRIALACTLDRGWHRTAAMGVFGTTAAACKLTGLSAE